MKIYFIDLKNFYRGGLLAALAVILFGWGYLLVQYWSTVPTAEIEPIYQGSENEKKIALTMNVVWGEDYIPEILHILKENNIYITFFIGGQFAEKFPEVTKQIKIEGHEIGSHGYSHPHPNNLSVEANLREIKKAEEVLYRITGKKTRLFAPPYSERGEAVLKAAAEAGYKFIMCSIDTIDWQRPSPAIITDRVLKKAHNGAIVLMHPTEPTTKSLPQIIKKLKERGYELVTVSQLLTGLEDEAVEETKGKGRIQ